MLKRCKYRQIYFTCNFFAINFVPIGRMRHIFPSFGTHISDLKTIINFRPFTLARMPAKPVPEI